MNIRRTLSKIKDVKFHDYISFFPMLAGAVLSVFFYKKYKDFWCICERKNEARDNGYHFFKYMIENHPEQKSLYAIDKKSSDYRKIKDLGGEIIGFGSIQHWMAYFSGKYLISSTGFKPNAYVCTLIERAGFFSPEHVFLQHGITINKPEYLLSSMVKFKYFITATPQETLFVSNCLGHSDSVVKMCGFSRFDALHDFAPQNGRILIMPTWRKWLKFKSEEHEDVACDFLSSEYTLMWKNLLTSPVLQCIIEKNNLEIIFIPHPNMIGIINPHIMVGNKIRVAEPDEDIQELLKSSKLLITDYSSVFFDMIYMKKPVIFYQFDEDKFRKYHYEKGWFDYNKTNFGRKLTNPDDVISEIERLLEVDYQVGREYIEEHKRVFTLYDCNNSERIYRLLLEQSRGDKRC